MKLGDIVKKYSEEHSLSYREFARKAGLSNTYITNIVNKPNSNPSLDALKSIASVMGISSVRLFEMLDDDQIFELKAPSNVTQIPLYSSISCGTGMFVDDNIEDYIAVPDKYIRPHHDYFANTACGDSMIGKGIEPGNVLIFEKANILDNGQIGAFCINDEDAVCKVFRKLSSGIILLESANPKYEPIEIDLMKDDCFKIVGKLVGSFRQY